MKKAMIPFLCLAFFAVSINTMSQCADTNNIYTFFYNGSKYELVREMKTWVQAAACAVERGGYLAHIDDQAEQSAVYDAIISGAGVSPTYTSVANGGGIAYVWIGATDKVAEGMWHWDGNDDAIGVNFWNGQGAAGTGGGNAIGGAYINWGGTATGTPMEPDDFGSGQDYAAIGLTGWPSGTTTLGDTGEWNDIAGSSSIYYIIEFDSAASGHGENMLQDQDMLIVPNPSCGIFRIHFPETSAGLLLLRIHSLDGSLAMEQHTFGRNLPEVNIARLKSGMYVLTAILEDGSQFRQKIIRD